MTIAELEPELAQPVVVYTTRAVAELIGVTPGRVRVAEFRGRIPRAHRTEGTWDCFYLESELGAIAEYFEGRERR